MMITKLFKFDLTMPFKIVPKYTGSKIRLYCKRPNFWNGTTCFLIGIYIFRLDWTASFMTLLSHVIS